MIKIDDLILKQNQNKLDYYKLKDLCIIETGKLNANEEVENGKYLFFTTSKIPSLINKYRWDEEALLIAGNANVGEVKYYNGKFEAYQRVYVLNKFSNKIEVKFLFYVLSSKLKTYLNDKKNEAAMTYIVLSTLENFPITLPSLKVQNYVIKVLDNFSELIEELKIELKARKKQYDYYKEDILSFRKNQEVKWLTLGEIATQMYRGSGIKKDEITETGIQCVRYGEIYTKYGIWFDKCISHTNLRKIQNPKYFEYGDVLFAITGESVEEIAKSCVYIGKERCLAGGDIVVMKHEQNPKYISYVLSTKMAQLQKSKGKVKSKVVHSSVPALKNIVLPIPSLEEQQRIVDVLDKFDKLVNDISEGIPAEIAARQKQYEYYRDKLLTFKEVGNESI